MRVAGALALAAALFVAGAAPAAAYQTLEDWGPHGAVWLNDSATPAAKCGYGNLISDNWAWFKWMRVDAPVVYAADRNSDKRDHRKVSWMFKIQVVPFSGGSWRTVAKSSVQRAVAYEDQAAPFTAMKVYWKAPHTGPTAGNLKVRAVVIVKWFKPSGALEARVKMAPDWYSLGSPFNSETGSPYCQDRATLG